MSDINSTIQLKLDYEEKCSNYWIDFITGHQNYIILTFIINIYYYY